MTRLALSNCHSKESEDSKSCAKAVGIFGDACWSFFPAKVTARSRRRVGPDYAMHGELNHAGYTAMPSEPRWRKSFPSKEKKFSLSPDPGLVSGLAWTCGDERKFLKTLWLAGL